MSLSIFMPIVDDENNLVGALPRRLIHRMPIHQAVSVFLRRHDGGIYFQKRSLASRGFPGCYDIVGGHVKGYKEYLETAVDEVASETPVRIDGTRFVQIYPSGKDAFFRIRTPHNSENKAVFLVTLEPKEEEEFNETVAEIGNIWHSVSLSVVGNPDVGGAAALASLREHAHKDETRKTTELGELLQSEFQKRIESAKRPGDERLFKMLKMAREVEAYTPMPLPQAIRRYWENPNEFADGFYSLIDCKRNLAPQAMSYEADIRKAIEGV